MKNAGPESKEISDGNPAGIRRVFPLPHSPALPLHPPPQIPDHELLRCIGRGSYGEVWLARTVLGQYRAVKVVYRDTFEHDRPFEREYEGMQKFEPISRSHPSQLAILHVGRNDEAGYFYYVMELADPVEMKKAERRRQNEKAAGSGSSVSSFCLLTCALEDYRPKTLKHLLHERGRLPFEECLQIGIALTTALEHLHKHGLVHRDIKPSNIVFVNGVPKLADIGLVTSLDATLSFVGTAGYFPPEGPGTLAADLYSLGKVLYEASMGRDRQEFPKLPADLSESAERERLLELNTVILKACHSDVRQRYQSTKEMHAELALLQSGKSVKQRRSSERRWGIVKRICIVGAFLAVTAGALTALFRDISPDTSNASYQLSRNPSAKKEYLEGVHCALRVNKQGLAEALAHFTNAIAIDPKFTMAYNGLFEVYIGGEHLGLSSAETWVKVRASARKLLELDPTLAEAQAAQAWIDFLDWKWNTAEPRFRHAIRLNPKCAIAHMRYGFCLVHAGRPDAGRKELLTAEFLDPIHPKIKKNIGHVFYVKRQFREAIEQYQRATNLEPSYPNGHFFIGCAYRALGNYTNAIDEFEMYENLLGKGKDRVQVQEHFDALRGAYAQGGPRGYWLKCLENAQKASDLRAQARCYAKLNNYDQALILLEKVYTTNQLESLEFLFFDECWDPVHGDPRFIALLKKTGLKK